MDRPAGSGKYYAFALITVALWSTSATLVKSLTEGIDSLCLLGYTSFFATAVLVQSMWNDAVHMDAAGADAMAMMRGIRKASEVLWRRYGNVFLKTIHSLCKLANQRAFVEGF